MKEKQRILAGVVCALLFVASVFYTSDGQEEYGFWDRSNTQQNHRYGISRVAKAMSDTILQRDGKYLTKDRLNTVSLIVSEDHHGEGKKAIEYPVRQMRMYFSPVEYRRVKITGETYNAKEFNLKKYVKKRYDYAVCSDDEVIIKAYEEEGYRRLWQLDGICFLTYGDDTDQMPKE